MDRGPGLGPYFEAAPDNYLVLDPHLMIIGVSDAYLRATATTRDGLVGRHLFDAFPDNPGDADADGVANLRASLERMMSRRAPDRMPVQKYDIVVADGTYEERYWSSLNTPVLDQAGEVKCIIHKVEDVTHFVRLGLPATYDEIQDYARKAQASLTNVEEQLRQAQKLEALGRLAGGVAHDFNNLLSVILCTAGLLRIDLEGDELAQTELAEIEKVGLHGADLTRRLLTFSRQQVLDPRVLEVAAVMSELQPMVTRLLPENIETRMRLDIDAGCVRGDRTQLEQVLLNLAVNARDAMPSGGLFSVEVSATELTREYVETHAEVVAGRYVCLTVSDTGVGMDRATQARVFEPFFTTKPAGQGTGLGLSTVFGIVKQSGGFIWLYSEPGIGTTFKVYLPRVDEAPTPVAPRAAHPIVGGRERILLLEDDDRVRRSVVRILDRLGYDVTDTAHASEALRRCAHKETLPDLLITDVFMPEMSGREVGERARRLAPGLRVLFMSGSTDDMILQQGILSSGVPYLQKPITPEALGAKVRGVLDA